MVSKCGTSKLLELKQIDAVTAFLQTIFAKVPELENFELICFEKQNPKNKNWVFTLLITETKEQLEFT